MKTIITVVEYADGEIMVWDVSFPTIEAAIEAVEADIKDRDLCEIEPKPIEEYTWKGSQGQRRWEWEWVDVETKEEAGMVYFTETVIQE